MHSGDWVWLGVYCKREISPPATSILTYLHHAAESSGLMKGGMCPRGRYVGGMGERLMATRFCRFAGGISFSAFLL